MAFESIILDVTDAVATLTLNRPEKRNAIDLPMVREMHAALDELEGRDDVRALVLTGAGEKAFAAGADIAQLRERTGRDALRGWNSRLFERVERFAVPAIAAIRGAALGGGLELALACDIRLAGESAKLGQPEVGLGLMAAAGATYRLPRVIGLGRAKELIYTGRIIDAATACAWGLVNRVVPDASVLDEARALAREIASKAPIAVRLSKLALNGAAGGGAAAQGPTLESIAQAVCFGSQDKLEGTSAFLEKRKPAFKGT